MAMLMPSRDVNAKSSKQPSIFVVCSQKANNHLGATLFFFIHCQKASNRLRTVL